MGPIASTAKLHLIEAYASHHVLNHEISFGRQDDWLGPGLGGGMAYSNNAPNIYSFRINRIEPLHIPGSPAHRPISLRFYGRRTARSQLHSQSSVSRQPFDQPAECDHSRRPLGACREDQLPAYENLEFGFERTVIWAGKGHGAVNVDSFLRSFFSLTSPSPADKNGSRDPGARFGAFDFSYRLPFVRNWLTLYTDSEVHDDISPADAPRRAAYRPGLYLSHVPGVPKLDLRLEAVSTDPSSSNSAIHYGHFMYWEGLQRQGYTNQGQLLGDWIGREDKGGQAWMTYHLSGNEWFKQASAIKRPPAISFPAQQRQPLPARPARPTAHACRPAAPH